MNSEHFSEKRSNVNDELNEPNLTHSQNFQSRRKNIENNFSVNTRYILSGKFEYD